MASGQLKGKNELVLNLATVTDIMQAYVNSLIYPHDGPVEVTKVEFLSSGKQPTRVRVAFVSVAKPKPGPKGEAVGTLVE